MKKPASKTPSISRAAGAQGAGQVRLIGGRWRGSKLAVADAPGLRPTSDRVRETLFNWLMPMLPGARVLDLFAGSGALGLEAVSRGAASAVLVEHDAALAASLLETTRRLPGGEAATVVQADALAWLPAQPRSSFDLALVDPPFADVLHDKLLPALMPLLADNAWLYIEAPLGERIVLPSRWSLHREGTTREVRYRLFRHRARVEAAADTLPDDPAGHDGRPNEPSTE